MRATPRMTRDEIKRENRIVRNGFEALIGAPLPVPNVSRQAVFKRIKKPTNPDDLVLTYTETRIGQFTKQLGAKGGFKIGEYRILDDAQRREWHSQYEYAKANSAYDADKAPPDEIENWKWDAYCVLIGIPAMSRIDSMFQMLPAENQPEREWDWKIVASVALDKLLDVDLEQTMQFMIWYAEGWPDTFMGLLEKEKAHKCFFHALRKVLARDWPEAPKLEEVANINELNAAMLVPAYLAGKPKTVKLKPAKFTDIMEAAEPEKFK